MTEQESLVIQESVVNFIEQLDEEYEKDLIAHSIWNGMSYEEELAHEHE